MNTRINNDKPENEVIIEENYDHSKIIPRINNKRINKRTEKSIQRYVNNRRLNISSEKGDKKTEISSNIYK